MSLSDVTKALEAAVASADSKRKYAEDAKKSFDAANAAYAEARAKVKELHTQYSQHMEQILTGHGQLHK